MKHIDWNRIRGHYPIFNDRTYLRTNGGGPLSNVYLQALKEVAASASLQGRIWEDYWDDQSKTKKLISELFNCSANEVAISHTVSLAMNHISSMLPSDLKVLTFRDEYPSNTVPFIEKGYATAYIESDGSGDIDFGQIESGVVDADVIVVSHVEYKTGYKHDLMKLGRLCKENGLIFIVDATQSAGVVDIDFRACGADAVVFSTHKWLNGGYGLACMIISDDLTKRYSTDIVGWNSMIQYDNNDAITHSRKKDAGVYELGHPDFLAIHAFMAQLNFISDIGINSIQHRIEELRRYLEQRCNETNLDILNDFSMTNKTGMTILKIQEGKINELKEAGLDFTCQGNNIMIALSYYNSVEDIDKFIGIAAYNPLVG